MSGGDAEGGNAMALSDEAIDWVVRLQSGGSTPDEVAAFAEWRRRSAAHETAACDAEALWQDFGETPTAKAHAARVERGLPSDARQTEDRQPAGPQPGRVQAAVVPMRGRRMRRALLAGGLAASLAFAVAGSGLFGPFAGLYADYATAPGERQEVRLPDGSKAILNTASALSLSYSTGGERRVELHAGEALFEVEHDEARPFVVASGAGEVHVLGTVFAVRQDADDVQVVVLEGRVRLAAPNQAAELVQNQQASYSAEGVGDPVTVDVHKATAWTRGKLIFNQRPLAEVVAEMERYFAGRIFIADEGLKKLKVTGVFDLKDPHAVLRALESTLGLTVSQLPLVTVIH